VDEAHAVHVIKEHDAMLGDDAGDTGVDCVDLGLGCGLVEGHVVSDIYRHGCVLLSWDCVGSMM